MAACGHFTGKLKPPRLLGEDAAELADASGRICCAAADLPSDSRAGFHFARVGRHGRSEHLRTLISPSRWGAAPA